jgi:hypothetical protein
VTEKELARGAAHCLAIIRHAQGPASLPEGKTGLTPGGKDPPRNAPPLAGSPNAHPSADTLLRVVRHRPLVLA